MLMHAHDRAVDHLNLAVVSLRNGCQQLVPDAGLAPAHEAIVAGRRWAIALGDIGPRRSRPQAPEYAVENTTVINPWHSARLARQQWIDDCPFRVTEFVATKLRHPNLPRLRV